MIEQKNKTWYVARRGELAAQQFLLELGPAKLSPTQELELGIDYMAFFETADGTIVVIAIEVKTTERDIKGKFEFSCSQAQRLMKMNIPVLILVVDVKDNNIYFNWIQDAIPEERRASLLDQSTCSIDLRISTADEREQLREEILQKQREFYSAKGDVSAFC